MNISVSRFSLCLLTMALMLNSCIIKKNLPQERNRYALSNEQRKPQPVPKVIGADISFLPELEAKSMQFKVDGVEKDAIQLLKENGFNYIRLRLFVNPAADSGYSPGKGFCDLEHTLQMAKRIKAAGLGFLLDFHYSDYWADPGKQYKPQSWKGLDFPALQEALYRHTFDVMNALKQQNTLPDMVQCGNEINNGMVWPDGNIDNPDQLAALIRSGTKAVKDVELRTIMMLHIALGGQHEESKYFLDQMLSRDVHFDVIGQSYYPEWHKTIPDLQANLNALATEYKKDIIVVEYSEKKKEVNEVAFNLPFSHGKGTMIWEPLNTWEKLFDENGNANELLKLYPVFHEKYLEK